MVRGQVVAVALLVSTAVGLAVSVDPSPAGALDAVDRVAAGDSHTCAIADDGDVWCWGDNTFGQLGNSGFPGEFSTVPVRVTSLGPGRSAQQIVAGANHTCVLANDSTIWCWGEGSFKQLGTSLGNQLDPIQVLLGDGITATRIHAGGDTSCAVTTDAHLMCWGRNTKGQIGIGTVTTSGGLTPTDVTGVPGTFTVSDVDPGNLHVCAVAAGGSMYCWGYDNSGQLGTVSDGFSDVLVPTAVDSPGAPAVSLSAGRNFTCAVLDDGSVSCWGANSSGQLGRGSTSPATTSASLTVSLPGAVSKVVAGDAHACALLTDGSVMCWGSSNFGQVGDGTDAGNVLTPSAVTGLGGTAKDITVGKNHACAVTVTGALKCWGANGSGQLGVDDALDRSTATTVRTVTVASTTTTTTTTTTEPPTTTTTTEPSTTTTTTEPPTTTTSTTTTTTEPSTTTTTTEPPTTTTSTTTTSTSTTTTSTTSTTSTTTTSTSTTTSSTVAPSTPGVMVDGVPTTVVPVPSMTTTEPPTTSTLTTTTTTVVARTPTMSMARSKSVAASRVASAVGLAIPKKSQGVMRISIMSGGSHCRFVGSSVRGLTPGTCRIRVMVVPRRGVAVARYLTLKITR